MIRILGHLGILFQPTAHLSHILADNHGVISISSNVGRAVSWVGMRGSLLRFYQTHQELATPHHTTPRATEPHATPQTTRQTHPVHGALLLPGISRGLHDTLVTRLPPSLMARSGVWWREVRRDGGMKYGPYFCDTGRAHGQASAQPPLVRPTPRSGTGLVVVTMQRSGRPIC